MLEKQLLTWEVLQMNNKGMTLVELLVTFSLLLVLVIGMFNLILEVKFQLDEKQIAKDLTEYSSVINNEIHYNLLRNKPFAIAYKNAINDTWHCSANDQGTCKGNDAGYVFESSKTGITSSNITKTKENLKSLCQNIYPCAVYAYVSGSTIEFKTIALNEAGTNGTSKLLSKHGIYYNDVYESVPDQEFVEVRGKYFINSNGTLVINFPIYIIENDKNYGFKIAYPFFQPK